MLYFLIFLGAAIILTAASPLPGIFRTRIPRVELVSRKDSNTILIMIHGTFAQTALWTSLQGNFLPNLQASSFNNFSAYRLIWSGCNFQWDREKAIRHLCKWIMECPPRTEFCIVGHSHGGNIAAIAATRMPDRNIKVVTLSTPFIALSPKEFNFMPVRGGYNKWRDKRSLITGVCCMLSLLIHSLIAYHTGLDTLKDIKFVLLLGILLVALNLNFWVLDSLKLYYRKRNKIVRSLKVQLPLEKILILRTTGDEASSLLGISSLISSILSLLFRFFGKLLAALRWISDATFKHPRIARGYIILSSPLAILISIDLKYIEKIPVEWLRSFILKDGDILVWAYFGSITLVLGLVQILFAPLLVILGAFASMMLSIVYGLDMALVSIFANISAEATPLGGHRVINISNPPRSMSHSSLYDSQKTARYIAEFFKNKVEQ